jgi:hypothetical protein
LSKFVSGDEFYFSELSNTQIPVPTSATGTPVVAPRLWEEEQGQYTIIAGTIAIYRPVPACAYEFDVDFVYNGTASSGIPTTLTNLVHPGMTNQAVTETAGMLVALLAINTPVAGPVETRTAEVDGSYVSGRYRGLLKNGLSRWTLTSRTVETFARSLKQTLRVEPVVDGYDHPAEGLLRETFKREPDIAAQWFLSALRENQNPSLMADSLRLLGRITPADTVWRGRIAAEGLRSQSAEVRDAAMQAIESWRDVALVDVLKDHQRREPKKWLREYANQLIQDLTE